MGALSTGLTGTKAFRFAASLGFVCMVAKLPALAERDFPITLSFISAIFWQDVMLALIVWPVFLALNTRWMPWILYPALVVYLAINSVLLLILSSPLTLSMARATGGALRDSIVTYLTPANCSIMGVLISVGLALPIGMQRLPLPWRTGLLVAGLACIIAGPHATARINTDGLHRNAIVAFARSLFPRVAARPGKQDWRASPFPGLQSPKDLSKFIGAAAGRNVVLISLESTGAQYLGPWGASRDPMPNLTRLAESSIIFENTYAAYPESIKGLLSTLCSIYPAMDTSTASHAATSSPSLARTLAFTGYTNALFHSGRFMYLGMDAVVQDRGFHLLCDAGGISGNVNSSFGVDEPATVDAMLEWLDTLPPSQPFFLCYLPIAGHHPYDAPARGQYPGATDQERYLNALFYGDKSLGHLLEELRLRHLDTNTLFVIYGDHGEAFGQHPANYGHTLQIYEENVRVPLLIAGPGLIERQLRVEGVASLIDVAPTLLDLLGLERPQDCSGCSLLRSPARMALFLTDYSLGLVGLRDGSWKFIHEIESGRSQLFDLAQDGEEQNNVALQQPDRVIAYRRRLLDWAGAQRYRAAAEAVSRRSNTPLTWSNSVDLSKK